MPSTSRSSRLPCLAVVSSMRKLRPRGTHVWAESGKREKEGQEKKEKQRHGEKEIGTDRETKREAEQERQTGCPGCASGFLLTVLLFVGHKRVV